MEGILSDQEELLLRSWDAPVNADERIRLTTIMQDDYALRRQSDQYIKIRELLRSKDNISFGPFFADRVAHVIRQRRENIDFQVFSFFKKYQVLILGVLVALLIMNLVIAEDLTLESIFGLGETEDIFSIDVYENLPQ